MFKAGPGQSGGRFRPENQLSGSRRHGNGACQRNRCRKTQGRKNQQSSVSRGNSRANCAGYCCLLLNKRNRTVDERRPVGSANGPSNVYIAARNGAACRDRDATTDCKFTCSVCSARGSAKRGGF